MSAPKPYDDKTPLLLNGEPGHVVSRVPHLDSWRYMVQADAAGPTGPMHVVSHEEIERTRIADDLTTRLPESALVLIADAGLSPDVFDAEHKLAEFEAGVDAKVAMFEAEAPRTPLQNFLDVVASDIRRGLASADVRAAYTTLREAGR